jgi:hypothetical protein
MSKLTTTRPALALAVAALLGGLGAVTFLVPTVGQAASNTVYQQTVAGTEAHSLSTIYEPAFTTSGGVIPVDVDLDHGTTNRYFESAFDVPTGAKITSLTVSYSGCGFVGEYVFGSYSLTGSTSRLFTLKPAASCGRRVITKTGTPITTVAAGRRYVLDWGFTQAVFPGYTDQQASEANTFYGATVKYTCTAPCVP